MNPYYEQDGVTIFHGDAAEIVPTLGEVDLIAVDPPYGGVVEAEWDQQWTNAGEFLKWLAYHVALWHAALKPNGSLYCFADPLLSLRVGAEVGKHFNVLSEIVWRKAGSRGHKVRKEDFRNYFPETERIIFAEHFGADNIAKGEAGYVAKCDEARGFVFEPIRAYLDGERERAGVSRPECNAALGNQMAGHYFSNVQWTLPTAENYAKLQALFNARGGAAALTRDYAALVEEFEVLRVKFEALRRPFNMRAGMRWSDVWEFRVPLGDERTWHPCQKPVEMLEHIVAVSTRTPSASYVPVVLDPFCGSGTALIAAKRLGRRAIGIDNDEKSCELAAQRLAQRVFQF